MDSNTFLIIAGHGLTPKISDLAVTNVFLEVSSTLAKHIQAELLNRQVQATIYEKSSADGPLAETIGQQLAVSRYSSIVIIYVIYLENSAVAVDLHCHNLNYSDNGATVEGDINAQFDMTSKPEKTLTSVASEYVQLLLNSSP